jgi:hypothetical protein
VARKLCRECRAEVRTNARFCPHCGVRSPLARDPLAALDLRVSYGARRVTRFAIVATLFVPLLAFGYMMLEQFKVSPPPSSAPETEVSQPFARSANVPAASPAPSSCEIDWAKCTDNADLVNNSEKWTRVRAFCKAEVERQARYGIPKWPLVPFSGFMKGKGYVTLGKALAIENDAQIQNSSGAMVRSTVVCTYDLRTDRILNVVVSAAP